MKIFEITQNSRKLIKRMESLYMTYAVYNSSSAEKELWAIIEENKNSQDIDVVKQTAIYKTKLHDDLIRILSK